MNVPALVTAAALALIPCEAWAEVVDLTLKQAVRLGVEQNLALKAELYNAAIAQAEVRKTRGIYNTGLTLGASWQDSDTFPVSTGGPSRQKTLKLLTGINRLVPTGGTFGFQFNNYYNETDYSSSTYPRYWQSEVTFALNQPLLRNLGPQVTNLNIVVAEQAREGAVKRVAGRIQNLVAQIRIEYFKLHSLREDLRSREVSLGLSRRVLGEIEERVKAGVLPPMEILNAKYGVAAREKEVIDADKALRDQVDLLRQILQMPPGEINAVDAPDLTRVTADEAEGIRRALALRPELDEAKLQIESAETQRRGARNKTLPGLNLYGTWTYGGMGEQYNQDMNRLVRADTPVWTAGLQFEYPLGNDAAEAEYVKSRLRLDQSKTQLNNLNSLVVTDVRSALRAMDASFKQLDVTAREKEFAEERLSAYISKSEVGLATARDVLDVENDLARARSNQIKAQVNYVTAVTQYLQATGELLEREGITVNGRTVEELLAGKH
ncbi:TolC family protein [Geomonas sp. Red69]|uniref:TolC family protein n=1 Tax=Geomonas diazotrophica TaxID=2843197 RepID=UPI001C1133D9|nr:MULTISPECIES: TolC family protein [Geomonas]MBU5635340.1 TolC family protein [Geomonas diazotrophica]QXE86745.1 TolC family protein [Geomonas nitrogeniifigens]